MEEAKYQAIDNKNASHEVQISEKEIGSITIIPGSIRRRRVCR
jgi:hypothetical protein